MKYSTTSRRAGKRIVGGQSAFSQQRITPGALLSVVGGPRPKKEIYFSRECETEVSFKKLHAAGSVPFVAYVRKD